MATTSANRSGQLTPHDGPGVAAALSGTEVAAVLDGGTINGEASTVVRVDDDGITVLRRGPLIDAVLRVAAADLA